MESRDYWFTNLGINFACGMAAGYLLENSGVSLSPADIFLAFSIPVTIGSLEYITESIDRTLNPEKFDAIFRGNMLGFSTFFAGDIFGRYVAKSKIIDYFML